MKNFRILNYIRKYRVLIALFSLAAGVLFYLYASNSQTYTANTVIQFANYDSNNGKAPDGTTIDLSEISSAKVMTEVFDELGIAYEGDYFDEMRSRVQVDPVLDSEAASIQEALNSQGESYSEEPTEYRVSFTAKNSEGEEFAQLVLNTLIEKYIVYYSENHINQQVVANATSDIASTSYDYIEIMELLDDGIESAKEALLSKYDTDYSFRSVTTGYSFYDLYCEFDYLSNVKVSDIYAKILDNQISRNKDVLISKYKQRISDYGLNNVKDDTEVQKVLDIIDSYVDMMKRSGNTEIDYQYILDQVYNTYNEEMQNGNVDRTVEYEVLLNNYVSNRESYEHDIIDAAYCQYIIDVFSEAKEGFTPYATKDEVKSDILSLIGKMNELYSLANQTNEDFNETLGAKNIVTLASTDVVEGVNVKLYLVVALVLFGIIGCIGAILLGRTTEMFEYYAYTDRKSGLANKAKCDEYMDNYRNKYISADQGCIALTVSGQLGEERMAPSIADDELVKSMGGILQDVFGSEEDAFLGYMGSGLFVVFNKEMSARKADYQTSLIESRVQAFNQENEKQIHFTSAYGESSLDKAFTIKDLFQKTCQKLYNEGENTGSGLAAEVELDDDSELYIEDEEPLEGIIDDEEL